MPKINLLMHMSLHNGLEPERDMELFFIRGLFGKRVLIEKQISFQLKYFLLESSALKNLSWFHMHSIIVYPVYIIMAIVLLSLLSDDYMVR